MNKYATFALCISLAAQCSFASAQAWNDMACLTADQQIKLESLARDLTERLQVKQDMERYRIASSQRSALQPEVSECMIKMNDPLQILDNLFSNCRSTIAKYNSLNGTANLLSARIKDNTEIILGTLRLERSMFPTCR